MNMTTTARWIMDCDSRCYLLQSRSREPRCRYCATPGRDCDLAECPLCGTVQCKNDPECQVCHYGWLYPQGLFAEDRQCGYKACTSDAIANAPRVRRVCAEHVERIKIHVTGGAIPLAEYVRRQVAQRDSGKGWQRWRLVS